MLPWSPSQSLEEGNGGPPKKTMTKPSSFRVSPTSSAPGLSGSWNYRFRRVARLIANQRPEGSDFSCRRGQSDLVNFRSGSYVLVFLTNSLSPKSFSAPSPSFSRAPCSLSDRSTRCDGNIGSGPSALASFFSQDFAYSKTARSVQPDRTESRAQWNQCGNQFRRLWRVYSIRAGFQYNYSGP